MGVIAHQAFYVAGGAIEADGTLPAACKGSKMLTFNVPPQFRDS